MRYCAAGGSLEGCAGAVALGQQLQAIASSPYEARRDSANLDASIIEVGIYLLLLPPRLEYMTSPSIIEVGL